MRDSTTEDVFSVFLIIDAILYDLKLITSQCNSLLLFIQVHGHIKNNEIEHYRLLLKKCPLRWVVLVY